MNYSETIQFLYSQLPVFQREGAAAYKANLDNTLALDERLNHPHKNYKTIHIAGTNGKGSVSHTLASVLQKQGYKVGLYTSPHLKDFRERIRVNGQMVEEQYVVDFVAENQPFIQSHQPSFFELTVGLAFKYFESKQVDIAVIEVGLGGRLDSTNIITPILSVITNISFDHKNLLGDTLEKIAFEKGGIIKPNIPVVIGRKECETSKVFEKLAQENRSTIIFTEEMFQTEHPFKTITNRQLFNIYSNKQLKYEKLEFDLMGFYQKENIVTILTAIELLKRGGLDISRESIYQGISSVTETTGLMGRWQTLGNNPLIICDTGHNEDGIRQIVEQIHQTPYKNLHMVIGMVNDKEIDDILALLPKEAQYYFTKADIPRSLDEKILQEKANSKGLIGNCYHKVALAIENAKKNAEVNDLIFIGGSTFIVAEAL